MAGWSACYGKKFFSIHFETILQYVDSSISINETVVPVFSKANPHSAALASIMPALSDCLVQAYFFALFSMLMRQKSSARKDVL